MRIYYIPETKIISICLPVFKSWKEIVFVHCRCSWGLHNSFDVISVWQPHCSLPLVPVPLPVLSLCFMLHIRMIIWEKKRSKFVKHYVGLFFTSVLVTELEKSSPKSKCHKWCRNVWFFFVVIRLITSLKFQSSLSRSNESWMTWHTVSNITWAFLIQ